MAFVVEDGTGLATANSYVTTAEFQSYIDERFPGLEVPTGTDLQALLIRATSYADTKYRFAGERKTHTQSLEWPRMYAYNKSEILIDSASLPDQLKYGVIELALYANSNELYPVSDMSVRSKRMGPVSVNYAPGGNGKVAIPAVESWFSWITTGSGLEVYRT